MGHIDELLGASRRPTHPSGRHAEIIARRAGALGDADTLAWLARAGDRGARDLARTHTANPDTLADELARNPGLDPDEGPAVLAALDLGLGTHTVRCDNQRRPRPIDHPAWNISADAVAAVILDVHGDCAHTQAAAARIATNTNLGIDIRTDALELFAATGGAPDHLLISGLGTSRDGDTRTPLDAVSDATLDWLARSSTQMWDPTFTQLGPTATRRIAARLEQLTRPDGSRPHQRLAERGATHRGWRLDPISGHITGSRAWLLAAAAERDSRTVDAICTRIQVETATGNDRDLVDELVAAVHANPHTTEARKAFLCAFAQPATAQEFVRTTTDVAAALTVVLDNPHVAADDINADWPTILEHLKAGAPDRIGDTLHQAMTDPDIAAELIAALPVAALGDLPKVPTIAAIDQLVDGNDAMWDTMAALCDTPGDLTVGELVANVRWLHQARDTRPAAAPDTESHDKQTATTGCHSLLR